ncbi:MAG: hypothetical protein AB2693_28400, partial [Candidatus Thiodiazotropha sp.]
TSCSSTLIDHIYTTTEENLTQINVCKISLSDHYAVFGNRKLNSFTRKHSHKTITYRSFRHFDESAFKNDLRQVPWEILNDLNDVNEILEVWNSLFLEVVNKHAPLKQHRVKRKHQPEWLSPEIIDCIKERNKCKINCQTDRYKELRNKVSSMIDSEKRKCIKPKLRKVKMIRGLYGKYSENSALQVNVRIGKYLR